MNNISKWYWKCRECGSMFDENEDLPKKPNPSNINQEVCRKCGGSLDLNFLVNIDPSKSRVFMETIKLVGANPLDHYIIVIKNERDQFLSQDSKFSRFVDDAIQFPSFDKACKTLDAIRDNNLHITILFIENKETS